MNIIIRATSRDEYADILDYYRVKGFTLYENDLISSQEDALKYYKQSPLLKIRIKNKDIVGTNYDTDVLSFEAAKQLSLDILE